MWDVTKPIDFFSDPKPRSLYKLNIYGKYLTPLVKKLGSQVGDGAPYSHVWIIDGFAGAGSYAPDDGGKRIAGSPMIAARTAREFEIARQYPVLKCINVESDEACFNELREVLAPWSSVAENMRGKFEANVDAILAKVGADPVLFFLDPFGVSGIQMELIERLLKREGKTEFLIHFSDKTFLRMAGHLSDSEEWLPTARKVADAKLQRLDALIGTPMWRRIWDEQSVDLENALDATAELYMAELRQKIRFAHQIRMRDKLHDRPAYRLVYCTDSPHGVDLMSDIACRYELDLRDAHEAGQVSLFEDQEKGMRKAKIRDAVLAEGLSRGSATPEELIHALAPRMFGEFKRSEYNAAIRALVNERLIVRNDAVGIKPRERLKFIPPAQSSLLL